MSITWCHWHYLDVFWMFGRALYIIFTICRDETAQMTCSQHSWTRGNTFSEWMSAREGLYSSPSTSLPFSQLVPNLLPHCTFHSPLCMLESGSELAAFVSLATYFSTKCGGMKVDVVLSVFPPFAAAFSHETQPYLAHRDVSFVPFAVCVLKQTRLFMQNRLLQHKVMQCTYWGHATDGVQFSCNWGNLKEGFKPELQLTWS